MPVEAASAQAHDQGQAEGMSQKGMRLLGLKQADLARRAKGDRAKQVLAWWLYGRTTVSRRWVAEKLVMGSETRVSQAVRWVESNRAPAVVDMKTKLTKCHL